MFATALTFILGASAAGWVLARLKMIAILAALLIITNGASALVFYIKGYNAAAGVCKVNEISRQRDEARRDLQVARETSTLLKQELDRQSTSLAENDRRIQQYAEELQDKERKLALADATLAAKRPKTCPACPVQRPCVVD